MYDDLATCIGGKEAFHIETEGSANHLEEQRAKSVDKVTFERPSSSTLSD